MKPSPFFIFALALLAILPACRQKLSDAQKSGLSLAALSAKERAAAFDAVKDKLKPVKESDALPLKNYLAAHAKVLNSQAVELADLVKAVQAGSVLSDSMRRMLAEDAKTAAAHARNFDLALPSIQADPDAAVFLSSHAAALKAQAQSMAELAALFPPKPDKPAAK